MGTARFLAGRLVVALLFVVVASSAALLLVRLAPGDATSELLLTGVSRETIAAERERLGVDRSFWSHWTQWISGLPTFDLGQSSRFARPVADLIGDRMANTALLAGSALVLAAGLGLPIGVLTGTRPRSWFAVVAGAVSVALVCCPPIIGTLALLLLGGATGWLSVSPGHLALPVLALAIPLAAILERLQSQATAEAFDSPTIQAAAARGLPVGALVWRHAARQGLRPVLGVAGIVIASLFSGSVAVETITAWPGLGRLMLEALLSRDLYLVAGCALAGATLVAAGNFAADLLRAAADPRIRQAT